VNPHRKEQVVLRLLRGESLDLLARETGQPAGRIAGWREEFLQAGREGLKLRPRPEAPLRRWLLLRKRPLPNGDRSPRGTFGRTYNQQWLIERHGYRTPTETREHLLREGVDRKQRHEPEPTSASGLS
jgi:hypothetical protein